MLPSRPAPAGPFTRSVREALEAAVSPGAAQNVLAEALKRGSLMGVPEEIEPFRRFCEGPFRGAVRASMGESSVEQVFERLGHVLWMATSDLTALETARAWSRGTGETPRPSWDEDSGVRHVEPPPRRSPVPPPAPAEDKDHPSGAALKRPTVPAPPPPSATTRNLSDSAVARQQATGATLGRMRAPTLTTRAATGSSPGASAVEVRASIAGDSRSDPESPGRHSSKPPLRASSPVPDAPTGPAPSAVLVISLDPHLVSDIRQDLAGQCPVRSIGTPNELALAITTAGRRPVVVVDTALPSIDVTTFAGLAPILPEGARVILWGAAPRQKERLATHFPHAAAWVASGTAPRAGHFILALP